MLDLRWHCSKASSFLVAANDIVPYKLQDNDHLSQTPEALTCRTTESVTVVVVSRPLPRGND